jgi:outer membrane protein assembly factor BamB
MVKHDPQFTGRSLYKGPQTATVIWTKDLPNGIFSGPVIGEEGNLYFGTYFQDPQLQGVSDYFYCYDSDGNFVWEYKLKTNRPPQTGIVIDSNHTIYFGSLDKHLYALNPDGSLKWKFETSGPIFEATIPNIDLQGNIYITNANKKLYSIKPDGSLNWDTTFESGFHQRSPVLSPDGNTIYIAGRDSNLFAINLDGSLKWIFNCGIIRQAPMIDNAGNIYCTPRRYLYSLSPDGNINWFYETNHSDYSIPSIDNEGNIYTIETTSFPIFYHSLISLTYDGNFIWRYDLNIDNEFDDFWQPLICDNEGTIYLGSTRGEYYYAISKDGELKWKMNLNQYQVDNTGAIGEDGTLYIGVHKSSLSPGLTKTLIAIKDTGTVSINEEHNRIKIYSLSQNFPNPFNPTTTINYQLPVSGMVQIKVYDLLGSEVAVLVNEFKSEGFYSVDFEAGNLPSGVYIYSLRVNDFVQNNKMTLLK